MFEELKNLIDVATKKSSEFQGVYSQFENDYGTLITGLLAVNSQLSKIVYNLDEIKRAYLAHHITADQKSVAIQQQITEAKIVIDGYEIPSSNVAKQYKSQQLQQFGFCGEIVEILAKAQSIVNRLYDVAVSQKLTLVHSHIPATLEEQLKTLNNSIGIIRQSN